MDGLSCHINKDCWGGDCPFSWAWGSLPTLMVRKPGPQQGCESVMEIAFCLCAAPGIELAECKDSTSDDGPDRCHGRGTSWL